MPPPEHSRQALLAHQALLCWQPCLQRHEDCKAAIHSGRHGFEKNRGRDVQIRDAIAVLGEPGFRKEPDRHVGADAHLFQATAYFAVRATVAT